MKKTLLYIFMSITFASCSFLEEKVTTSYGGGNAMDSADSEAALEANILGCHRQLAASGFKTGAFCEWLAPASGIAHWGNASALANPLERWTCCLKFTRFSKHPEAYESFTSLYRAAYRCNSLLSALPGSPVDEGYKTEIEGEALFIRAMAYFWLVRLYGDVSLNLTVPTDVESVYSERSDFWRVYCQIVEDLDGAAEKMRSYDKMIAVTGGNSSGRVCNYAAVACRSLVYLTIGTLLAHPDDNFWLSDRTPDFSGIGISTAEDAFVKALADAEDVIENGPFELCPDYRWLFRWSEPSDWQLKERIWALPRSPESDDSGSALTMWALPNYYMGTSAVLNFGRCRPDRWFFQKWCETYRGSKGTGTNNRNIYVNCADPRLNVNIAHTSYIGKDGKPFNCYPADNRVFPGDENMMKYYGFPYYRKYYDPTYDNSLGNADFYVMRLAEVYLIAAEAEANLSAGPADSHADKAIAYVNVLLERARNSTDGAPAVEPRAWDSADFADRDALIDRIFWERCFEMPFEQHEYFDTHRMGAKWLVRNISGPKNAFLYLPEQDDFTLNEKSYDGYRTVYYGADFRYDEDWNLVRKGLISAYPYNELVYNTKLDVALQDPNKGQNPEPVYWR